MSLPSLFRVRQKFPDQAIEDVEVEVRRELESLALEQRIKPGQSVAVTVGSRGIDRLVEIVRAIVAYLKSIQAEPFVVPTMGSHGGGTVDGQIAVLHSYGVTEEAVGCPIRTATEDGQNVDARLIGTSADGIPIHFNRAAFEADHIFVFNRVKPHTSFTGSVESGLLKMLLIGLGGPDGARVYHQAIQRFSFEHIIRSTARQVIDLCPIVAGLAVVENAYDRVSTVRGVLPEAFEDTDQELLVLAREQIPSLPFEKIDLLLVDQIGKNISGTGLDTNLVGRKTYDHKAAETETPKTQRIAVRRLAEGSHGNAIGIGIAEFCRSDLIETVNWDATRLNALTSGRVPAAMQPLDYPTDREMISVALNTVGLPDITKARMIWIHDTLHVTELECSEAYYEEAVRRSDLEVLASPSEIQFDESGNLIERF